MGRAIALLMLGAAMPACAAASDSPMAITDVIANIDALNGRTIRVAGYLGDCAGYECRLFRSPEDKVESDRTYRALLAHRAGQPRPPIVDTPALGIGSGENFGFDRQAAPFTNGYVVITGRVTNRCRYQGRPGCTDRSTDLEPTGIERWSPPASPTGNRT